LPSALVGTTSQVKVTRRSLLCRNTDVKP